MKKKSKPVLFNISNAISYSNSAKYAPAGVNYSSMILGSGWVDPKYLISYPDNHRKHSAEQLKIIDASLSTNGWNDTIKVSSRSSFVLNGNARLEQAIKTGQPYVPFTLLDIKTEEQEKLVLALYDRTAEDAEIDWKAMEELLTGIEKQENATLELYLAGIEQQVKNEIDKLDTFEETGFVEENVDDVIGQFDTGSGSKKNSHQKVFLSDVEMGEVTKLLKKQGKTVELNGSPILLIVGGYNSTEE